MMAAAVVLLVGAWLVVDGSGRGVAAPILEPAASHHDETDEDDDSAVDEDSEIDGDASTGPGLVVALGDRPSDPIAVEEPVAVPGSSAPVVALPEMLRFEVGQCLTAPTDQFSDPLVVPCDDPSAVDRVVAISDAAEIECPPSASGASTSHTSTQTNEAGSVSFSWCTEPNLGSPQLPAAADMTDGLLTIGSCYATQPTENGKVTVTEEVCVPGAGRYEVVGESPDAGCGAVAESTGSLEKLEAEGTGYWCVREVG